MPKRLLSASSELLTVSKMASSSRLRSGAERFGHIHRGLHGGGSGRHRFVGIAQPKEIVCARGSAFRESE
jgi:hypothetical protein